MQITTNPIQAPESLEPLEKQVNPSVQPPAVPDYTAAMENVFGAKSVPGIRGESKEQQTQTFAQESLQLAELGLESIPVLGSFLSLGLGKLAASGEGQRAVKAVCTAVEQGYEAQKSLLKGDVAGAVNAFEGGSSHQQREATFYGAVTSRIQELQTKGGVLTAQDVAGFKQAIAYGDIHPLGTDVDLTKIDLVVGTNPFGGPSET